MTLSALTSTLGGMVRPICFAVFRLITNSNFVGCSTGQIGRLGALEDLIHVVGVRGAFSTSWCRRTSGRPHRQTHLSGYIAGRRFFALEVHNSALTIAE